MGHAALFGSGFYSLREFVIFHPAFCKIQCHLASIRYDGAVSFLYAVYVYRKLEIAHIFYNVQVFSPQWCCFFVRVFQRRAIFHRMTGEETKANVLSFSFWIACLYSQGDLSSLATFPGWLRALRHMSQSYLPVPTRQQAYLSILPILQTILCTGWLTELCAAVS